MYRRIVFAAVAVAWLTACLPYARPSVVTNPDDSTDLKFEGLESALETNSVVNVLVVHGMGTHDNTYADRFLDDLQHEGKLSVKSACVLVDRLVTGHGSYSTVHRCSYQTVAGHELRVFILTWSKLTEVFEDQLLAYDWQLHGRERVKINGQLKRYLIDTSFDDAVMFSGTYAPVLRGAVERALCVLLTNKTRPDVACQALTVMDERGAELVKQPPIFLVAHSLGSVLVIETLGTMLPSCAEADDWTPARGKLLLPPKPIFQTALARVFVRNIHGAFLLANQLPLLYLSRIQPPTEQKDLSPSESAIRAFGQALCPVTLAFGARDVPVPLVAFNDPNDLLTFPLQAGWRDRIAPDAAASLKLLNVLVVNAPNRWLGVAVSPSKAHTGYWSNLVVIRHILKGHS